MAIKHALVRPVPDSFARALVRHGEPLLDPSKARAQHVDYCAHLAAAGYVLAEVPTDEACPDCVFIEDAAAVIGSVAVITRPGAPTRRPEVGPVATALSHYLTTTTIDEPATVDGGDVFTLEDTVYVGRSQRTNQEGIDQLRAIAGQQGFGLIAVGVYDTLHLKSAVLPVGDTTVVVTPGSVEEEVLAGLRLIHEDSTERYRFSGLPLRNGTLLTTASAPRTTATLAAAGYRPVPIDVSELQAADGGLTCMSILL